MIDLIILALLTGAVTLTVLRLSEAQLLFHTSWTGPATGHGTAEGDRSTQTKRAGFLSLVFGGGTVLGSGWLGA